MITFGDFLKKQDAGTVLDIACGGGTFTKRLLENLKSYTSIIGLDIKAEFRDGFLETVDGHDVSFVASSIHDYLKTTDNRFDTISISNALHHLEDVGEVLKNVWNILNDGGTVIVNEMHGDNLTPAQQTQHDQHKFLANLHSTVGEYHRETWSRREILDFVTNAKLSVQHEYENKNEDAPITKEPNRMVERARDAIEKAYQAGAPDDIILERDRLAVRSSEIGSSPPPQLTLVCVQA
jgi:ubiquinone/menaquinone biosynthesis C-methylase UbiE